MRDAGNRARAQAKVQALPQPLLWSIGMLLSATALFLALVG
jgi:hypothetical protein